MTDWVLPALHDPAPGEAAVGLQVRLFGPLEVTIGAHPLPRLRTRKGLWLLALLALRAGRDVERDWLAGTLWPDGDDAQARHSLRQCLHDLRRVLAAQAGRLTGEPPRMLRLELAGAFVDVLAFDAAVARGDLASLEEAVRLYRGPLLAECAEEWVLAERQQREQAYLAALERLAAAATARGEHGAAASYLRRALDTDPYREELQRALMEALAAAGSPADALVAYRQFRTLLLREMAAEPAAETTALFHRLRDETRVRASARTTGPPAPAAPHPPTATSPVPRPLPLPLTELIGRVEEVQAVISRLAGARLVTLTGTGGIGKTRLALEVASTLAAEYVDGVGFVNFASLADPERLADAVRAALEVPPGDAQAEPIELLRQYLSSRRLLLVLDNCEHLVDACAQLADPLLGQCPGLRILATSRQPLGVRGETVWRVPSLSLPPIVESPAKTGASEPSPLNPELSTLLQYGAVRLFVERARAAEATFEMTTRNAPDIVEVCRRLDGIPLAIELAAARVRAMPVEQIALRLDDRFRLLTGGGRTDLPRQQTLRASIDWSYDLLSEAERRLLRLLSVFAGGWTLEAAEAVCGEDEESGWCDTLDLLQGLVEKSLVVYEEQGGSRAPISGGGGGARYWMLETVRQYARDRLLEEGEGDASRARHLDYFLALAEAAEPHLRTDQRGEWLERLETEHDNLRTALDWCLSAAEGQGPGTREAVGVESEAALRLAAALMNFWTVRGHLTEGRERLAQALARAAGAGTSAARGAVRAKALNAAGSLAYAHADYRAAGSLHKESLAIQRELGHRWGIALSLNNLGRVAGAQGDYEMARSLYEESLAIRRDIGDRLGIAGSLDNLALVARDQRDYGLARSLYEESLAILRELGDRLGIAGSLNRLGMLASKQRDYRAARSHYEESLVIRRELEDRSGISGSLQALAELACEEQGPPGAGEGSGTREGVLEPASGDREGAGWHAARLFGAAAALREAMGAALTPSEQEAHRRAVSRVREMLDEAAFAAAWAEGAAMSLENAIAYALCVE